MLYTIHNIICSYSFQHLSTIYFNVNVFMKYLHTKKMIFANFFFFIHLNTYDYLLKIIFNTVYENFIVSLEWSGIGLRFVMARGRDDCSLKVVR